MTIAITGATGNLGSQVITHLLEKNLNEPVIAVVRNEVKAREQLPTDVEVRYGDYTLHNSLVKAFDGVDKLLFISSPSTDDLERTIQHATVLKAARDAGIARIYYTSFSNADHSVIPLAKLHVATEAIIKVSGLDYTFLRNPLYTEVFINPSLKETVSSGTLVSNTGSGRLNTASRSDLAKATAELLTKVGYKNEVVELASSTTWSFQDLADTLSEVSGNEVEYQAVSSKEALNHFISTGLPEPAAQFTVSLYDAIADGDIEQPSTQLKELIEKETSLKEAVSSSLSS